MSGPSTQRPWRYALASVIGTSHERSGSPCQDASACEITGHAGASLLVSAVADGAGSARHSRIGSRLACQVVHDSVKLLLDVGGTIEDIDRIFAESVLARVQIVIQRVARKANARPRDFACTLLAGFVGSDRAAFLQVGDGAIVIAPGRPGSTGEYDWVFWPENGEYANETVFATSSIARDHLRFAVIPTAVEELALFSDGLQNLVLDHKNKAAHSGFFAPMFRAVQKGQPGYSKNLSGYLAKFLGSRKVTGRTDDDKTLVLATRRQPEPAPALPSRTTAAPAADRYPAVSSPERPAQVSETRPDAAPEPREREA